MTETFKASNEFEISKDEDGDLEILDLEEGTKSYVFKRHFQALREFFLHELGIWQDPENPHLLLMRKSKSDDEDGRAVRIIDTHDKTSYLEWECSPSSGGLSNTVNRYFAAHPESKPWQDAKIDEVWMLTVNLVEDQLEAPFITDLEENFVNPGLEISITSRNILDGRRIYSPTEEA